MTFIDDLSPSDNELLRELADAVDVPSMPDSLRESCLGLLAWRTVDADLAQLLETSALAGVRSSEADTIVFSTTPGPGYQDGTTIELTLGERLGAVVGRISPPAPGDIKVQTRNGIVSAPVDDEGRFHIPTIVRGAFRLRVELTDRRAMVTSWTLAA